jgi:hypothetical protein
MTSTSLNCELSLEIKVICHCALSACSRNQRSEGFDSTTAFFYFISKHEKYVRHRRTIIASIICSCAVLKSLLRSSVRCCEVIPLLLSHYVYYNTR